MPAHHLLAEYLDAYLAAAAIEPKGPLFRTVRGRSDRLSANRLQERNASSPGRA